MSGLRDPKLVPKPVGPQPVGEWEIDSDGHWHERSPLSIEMPDWYSPSDVYSEEELREMHTTRQAVLQEAQITQATASAHNAESQ